MMDRLRDSDETWGLSRTTYAQRYKAMRRERERNRRERSRSRRAVARPAITVREFVLSEPMSDIARELNLRSVVENKEREITFGGMTGSAAKVMRVSLPYLPFLHGEA